MWHGRAGGAGVAQQSGRTALAHAAQATRGTSSWLLAATPAPVSQPRRPIAEHNPKALELPIEVQQSPCLAAGSRFLCVTAFQTRSGQQKLLLKIALFWVLPSLPREESQGALAGCGFLPWLGTERGASRVPARALPAPPVSPARGEACLTRLDPAPLRQAWSHSHASLLAGHRPSSTRTGTGHSHAGCGARRPPREDHAGSGLGKTGPAPWLGQKGHFVDKKSFFGKKKRKS